MRAVLVVALLVVAVVPSSVFAAVPPTLDGPNVVYYPQDMPFTSSSLEIIQGTRDSEGACDVDGPLLSTEADTASLGAEEIAFDPDTCRSQFAVGAVAPDPDDSAPADPTVARDEGGSEFDGVADGSGAAAAASSCCSRKVAVGYSAWEDPIQLDVNKVQNSVNFKASSTCAAASRGGLWDRISWRFGSGWYVLHRDLDRYWACDRVVSKTYARFRNRILGTRTRMWPNRTVGYPGGRTNHQCLGLSKTGTGADRLHSECKLSVKPTNDPSDQGF